MIEKREQLALLLEGTFDRVAVEVGVHQGVFAKSFLRYWHGLLFLVDPWKDPCTEFPTFYPTFSDDSNNREIDYVIAREALKKYQDQTIFFRNTSVVASKVLHNLDLVYIDGLHDYESVSQDIAAWYPKIKSGGWICGHDYSPDLPGVIQAVDEFVAVSGLVLNLTFELMPSWYVQKP